VRTRRIEPAFPLDNPVTAKTEMSFERKKRGKDNAPSHDGGCGHSLSPPLGLVILIPVRLVDNLLSDYLLDDICVYVWRHMEAVS
jgi:hypothetical protein